MGELGRVWVDNILFDAWERVAIYLKRIGHPDWMPAMVVHPTRNPRLDWVLEPKVLPQRVITDLAERNPMAGDLLRNVVNHGYRAGWERWQKKWVPKGKYFGDVQSKLMEPLPPELTIDQITDLAPYIYGTYENPNNDDADPEGQVLPSTQTPPPEWAFDTLVKLGLDPWSYRAWMRDAKPALVEYGCGYFGCVMPTHAPNVVLKLTTDKSEALFANLAASLGDKQPPGIVKYFAVVKLRGVTAKPDGDDHDVYLLWREEAYDVGYMNRIVTPLTHIVGTLFHTTRDIHGMLEQLRGSVRRNLADPRDFVPAYRHQLDEIQKQVRRIEKGVEPSWTTVDQIAKSLVAIPQILGEVYVPSPYKEGIPWALGLGVWLNQYQIAFADVHVGNVGQDKDGYAIVTDPGLAMEVGPKNYPAPQPKEI
ncbi:MAG: hypothetical protein GY772_29300 [bacterium]|nr:hypothetical protein [bacterium]